MPHALITGALPVGRYSLTLSCRPHKSIHNTLRHDPFTADRSLGTSNIATILNHRFENYINNISRQLNIVKKIFSVLKAESIRNGL